MSITYENAAKKITLEQAIWIYKRLGVAVIVNDGRDITLEIEEPTSSPAK